MNEEAPDSNEEDTFDDMLHEIADTLDVEYEDVTEAALAWFLSQPSSVQIGVVAAYVETDIE